MNLTDMNCLFDRDELLMTRSHKIQLNKKQKKTFKKSSVSPVTEQAALHVSEVVKSHPVNIN